MTKNKEKELLKEIAALLEKYGPTTFAKLAEHITEEDKDAQNIRLILQTAAKASKAKRVFSNRREVLKEFQSSLSLMSETKPQESEILIELLEEALAGAIFLKLSDMQKFLADLGLPSLNVKSRREAIIPLLKTLQSLTLGELQSAVALIPRSEQNEQSLRGWSDIILHEPNLPSEYD